MSSFTTNNNSRRTKRARVHGVLPDNGSGTIGSSAGKSFEHNSTLSVTGRKPGLVDTHIGSHNSRGLVINGGGAESDFHQADNPDDRTIPLGQSGEDDGLVNGYPNHTLAHPPFPVTFTGPGYLAFQQEVAMPFIRGDMHVMGNMIVDGSLTILNEGVPAVFAPVITDALGNELDGATVVSSVYITFTEVDYFECEISWTGFTQLVAGQALRLTGFPLTVYSEGSVPTFKAHGGLSTNAIGGEFHMQCVAGQSYIEMEQLDPSCSGIPEPVLEENFFGATGQIHAQGWLLKT